MQLKKWFLSNWSFKKPVFCLRIDVDTIWGLNQGIPIIAKILQEQKIPATFFIPTGPDNTGRNLFQIGKSKEFSRLKINKLKRFRKSKKELFYGIIKDGPYFNLQKKYKTNLLELIKDNHEIGLHGFNHEYWIRKFEESD
ncbi:MAG: polysaccharide deacetylase family protein, partial [Candidatus Hodarchaeales archaeon]